MLGVAAMHLRVSRSTLKKWNAEGFIHLSKIGGKLYVSIQELWRIKNELIVERRGIPLKSLARKFNVPERTMRRFCRKSRWVTLTRKGYRLLPEHQEHFTKEIVKES